MVFEKQIKVLYFEQKDTFEEEIIFLEESIKRYNLLLIKANYPYKEGLTNLKNKHPNLSVKKKKKFFLHIFFKFFKGHFSWR